MGVRKSTEETLVLAGTREIWLDKCRQALGEGGFSKIDVSPSQFQLQGTYKKVRGFQDTLLVVKKSNQPHLEALLALITVQLEK